MKHSLLMPVFFCLFITFIQGQNPYFPDKNWESKKPNEVKMNPILLDSAVNFALKNEVKMEYDLRIANMKSYAREPDYKILGPMKDRGKPAGIILKNGYIVAQWGDLERVDMTFSVTKSYLSTVAGLAVDNGLIENIDTVVKKHVWDDTYAGAHNGAVTWRHLLTQSSDWSGCLFDICDWADRPPKEGGIDDWKNRKLYPSGTQYEYNDVRVNVLSYSLLQVWRKPLPMVLKEKIMDPIGASSTWRWFGYEKSYVNLDGMMMQSVSGGGHHGGGIFINTLDQARFGLLFSRKGKWKNQQLISEKWVNSVNQPSSANPAYGLMWWTNQDGKMGDFSKNIYSANGYGGNFIVVDVEHDLVIVTRWLEPDKLGELVKIVLGGLEKGK
jgi:CubicO group peptidase (beta-lactamase class C family)